MADKEKKEPWRHKVVSGSEHPSHNPPLTVVAEASEEAAKREEDSVNAIREKEQIKTPEAAAAKPASEGEEVDLESKTVPELKEIAALKGVEIGWDDKKSDIIKAIQKGNRK
jgi:hypothetical protein